VLAQGGEDLPEGGARLGIDSVPAGRRSNRTAAGPQNLQSAKDQGRPAQLFLTYPVRSVRPGAREQLPTRSLPVNPLTLGVHQC
jgi:hypothetical protein